jgi:transposase
MTSVSRRRYSAEFKEQAIGLVNTGKPVAEVAQELEISEGVLYAWVRKGVGSLEAAQSGNKGARAAGELSAADELRRLRRENANLKLENDILKKAAVILATNPRSKPAR